jgi:hypothetical protein
LWPKDREDQIKAFVESEPLIQEIQAKFMKYEDISKGINSLPEFNTIGPLQICMGTCIILHI